METPDPKKIFQIKDFLDMVYQLHHSKHYEEFLTELGVARKTRMQAMDSKPVVKLSMVDDLYVLCTNYPEGRIVKVRFTNGERVQRRRLTESPTSSVFYVVGSKLREEQEVDGKFVVLEWEFGKKEMVMTMILNKVTCTRYYTAVVSDSVPSFATETSRRISEWDLEKTPKEQEKKPKPKNEESSVEIYRRCR